MQVYKDTYLFKNKETGEVIQRFEKFDEPLQVLSGIVKDFREFVKEKKSNSKAIKGFVENYKQKYKDVVIFRPYYNDTKSSVWGYLSNEFKHAFIETRPYFAQFNELIRAVYFRMGYSLADKAFIKVNPTDGRERVKELGVEFIDAMLYDSRFVHHEIVVGIEQLNLILLTQEEDNPYVEIDELHKDFVNNGLI